MTGVFASGLLAMLAITYLTLNGRAESIVRDRLSHAVRELAGTAETALTERANSLRAIARDPLVVSALTNPSPERSAAAGSALNTLLTSSSTLPVELRDPSGRVVASAGTALPDSPRTSPPSANTTGDSAIFSPIRPYQGGFVFWIYAPVESNGTRVGWLAQARRVSGRKDAEHFVREMLREDVHFNLANADGTFWAAAPGTPVEAPSRRTVSKRGVLYDRDGQLLMAEETQVRGTPWIMALEIPSASVYARPLRTIRLLAWLSLGLLVFGAAALWLLSRRITAPISALTAAAEAVAQNPDDHSVSPARGNEIDRLFRAFDEMTRRITAANIELEKRVQQSSTVAAELAKTNEQLRAAIDEADRATRAKGDFLAMMSHELRTPLNAIGGYADLIDLGVHGPITEAQHTALKRLGKSKSHLLALIDQVLTFARMNAGHGHYSIEDVSVERLLTSLEPLVAPQMEQRRITFRNISCDPSLAVRADPEALRQALLNLLGNAIKFTPEGGKIDVACDVSQTHVRLHVCDSGVGITRDRLDVIFEPFVQGERALSKPTEGVGLGLAITRDLVKGMGGTIRVASEPGRGSTFTVVLPLARKATNGAQDRESSSVEATV
jgi:signal transduction histidine kinase